MNAKNIGSSFDNWLREEGICEEVTAAAIKRVLARQKDAEIKSLVTQVVARASSTASES